VRIAVLSDIHGNSWALEKVMQDIKCRNISLVLNLGDTFYGPLDPAGTFDLLRYWKIISVAGNEDRMINERGLPNPTLEFVTKEIPDEAFIWLSDLPKITFYGPDMILFHGTPASDSEYLLESPDASGTHPRPAVEISRMINGFKQRLIFCGHSHIQRTVAVGAQTIINPGSVGCPAFEDNFPLYHRIENFSNFARYSIVEWNDDKILVDQIALQYDSEPAVRCAEKNNRPDWARWLKTGRV